MLDLLAASTTLLFVLAGFCVGLRLLWMARSTGGLPETSLGLGLFLIVGLGLPLQLAGLAIEAGGGSGGAPHGLAAASAVLMNAGWAAVWVFTWKVFRPGSALARTGVYASFAVLLVLSGLAVGAAASGDGASIGHHPARTLATVLLAQVLYVWTAAESLAYWRRMRKRVALGLADPVVANRFLLWAWVALLSFASLLAPLVLTLMGASYQTSAVGRLVTAVSGIGCAVALSLAFLPPDAYLRRLRAATETPGA